MEKICGITFDEYAAVNALIAQGQELEDLLPLLGREQHEWEKANEEWLKRMAEDPTFELVNRYGKIFSNPQEVAAFAGSKAETAEEHLDKVPTLERFVELQEIIALDIEGGMDAGTALAQYGLSIGAWGQLNMYWQEELLKQQGSSNTDHYQFMQHLHEVRRNARARYLAAKD